VTLGTKTLLFGVHQVFIHPLLVTIAWVKLYRSFPNWRELFCIFIHDWGYWGKPSLKDADGDTHPELGAKIAHRLFDMQSSLFFDRGGKRWTPSTHTKWQDFILGHSSFYIIRNEINPSKLLAHDKYFHCLIPLWAYKLLAVPTGEFKHYRELNHARQVSDLSVSDAEWWAKLQTVCRQKVDGTYKIDANKLA